MKYRWRYSIYERILIFCGQQQFSELIVETIIRPAFVLGKQTNYSSCHIYLPYKTATLGTAIL